MSRNIILALLVGAILAPSAAFSNPAAPIIVYHGGPRPDIGRELDSQHSKGKLMGYLSKKDPTEFMDRRRQLAEASSMDYFMEFTFSLRCVGIENKGGDCRPVNYVGPGSSGLHLDSMMAAGDGNLGMIVVDFSPWFDDGQFHSTADVTFATHGKPANQGTKIAIAYASESAASDARGDPLYKNSRDVTPRDRKKRGPARKYWFSDNPSKMDIEFQKHIGEVAIVIDHIMGLEGNTDELEHWYDALPTGKILFESKNQECPDACKDKFVELGDSQFLVVRKENGRLSDYTVNFL